MEAMRPNWKDRFPNFLILFSTHTGNSIKRSKRKDKGQVEKEEREKATGVTTLGPLLARPTFSTLPQKKERNKFSKRTKKNMAIERGKGVKGERRKKKGKSSVFVPIAPHSIKKNIREEEGRDRMMVRRRERKGRTGDGELWKRSLVYLLSKK